MRMTTFLAFFKELILNCNMVSSAHRGDYIIYVDSELYFETCEEQSGAASVRNRLA